jgi:hypothetical protein
MMMGDGDMTMGDGDVGDGDVGDGDVGDGDVGDGDVGDGDVGDGDGDVGDGDGDVGDGDGDASSLTEEEAIQLCEGFVNGSAMPTSDQTCTVDSAIATDTVEACEEATATCVADAEEDDDGVIHEMPDPCAAIVPALTGCDAKVADVEACFAAISTAQMALFNDTTCEAAGTITSDVYAPPAAECDAVKTACPDLFPSSEPLPDP